MDTAREAVIDTAREAVRGVIQVSSAFVVEVTVRLDELNRQHMTELTTKTALLWEYVARIAAEGIRQVSPLAKAAEAGIEGVTFYPTFEPRVTAEGEVKPGLKLVLHSYSKPQDALDTYYAWADGLKAFGAPLSIPKNLTNLDNPPNGFPGYPGTPPRQNPFSPSTNAAAGNLGAKTGKSESTPGTVIRATKAPTPNTPQYQPDQVVALPVNKIELGTRNGSLVYNFWGPLGAGRYPLHTVFVTRANSDEESQDYQAIKDVLEELGLSFDKRKLSVAGQWGLITTVSHKAGKEYLNPLMLKELAS